MEEIVSDAGAHGAGMLGMLPIARCLWVLFLAEGAWKGLGWLWG